MDILTIIRTFTDWIRGESPLPKYGPTWKHCLDEGISVSSVLFKTETKKTLTDFT